MPTHPPAGWRQVRLPSGAAVLSYPPSLERAHADPGSVTAEQKDAQGLIRIYLNATPRQGNEELSAWPGFRIHVLAEESASSWHKEAQAVDVPFLGGRGSCVLDEYVTRVKSHHYKEIACYVVGPHGGTVVVATTFASLWAREKRLLEQAVAAYRAT